MDVLSQSTRRQALQQITAALSLLSMGAANATPATQQQQLQGSSSTCIASAQHCTDIGQKALQALELPKGDLEATWQQVLANNINGLAQQIQHDFETLNTVTVDGWVLSKTEANLFALAALIRKA